MITAADITAAARACGVAPADTLFVHSDVSGCLRVDGRTRADKLTTIITGLAEAVADGTLIMPAFSYSFCRGEVFDRAHSPSTVGVLTEAFRSWPEVRRTSDPIFSTSVLGAVPPTWEQSLFARGDCDCFGERSIFAYLLQANAQHLCLGTRACTLIHHVEQTQAVPYRHFKDFCGDIIDGPALSHVTARYFVRPLSDEYDANLHPLFDVLAERGLQRTARLEKGPELYLSRARDIAETALGEMARHPDFLIAGGHPRRVGRPEG